MPPFLYSFFHTETNDRSEKGLVHIPKDPKEWPESWSKIEYKEYLLRKPILLTNIEGSLIELLKKRETVRTPHATSHTLLTKEKLSYIFQCGCGLRDQKTEKRMAPSGGSRYPIETYLLLFREVDGLMPGVYHYGVRSHALEPLILRTFTKDEIRSCTPYEWLYDAPGIICLSSVFKRSIEKYGSRGYRYILLEAGHIAQNMLLAGAEMQASMVPIGGVNEDLLESIIGLGSTHEKIVYTLYLQS
jgi:SagB-type dehydrogenase family enzyme